VPQLSQLFSLVRSIILLLAVPTDCRSVVVQTQYQIAKALTTALLCLRAQVMTLLKHTLTPVQVARLLVQVCLLNHAERDWCLQQGSQTTS
jgi:hypothetical protein